MDKFRVTTQITEEFCRSMILLLLQKGEPGAGGVVGDILMAHFGPHTEDCLNTTACLKYSN